MYLLARKCEFYPRLGLEGGGGGGGGGGSGPELPAVPVSPNLSIFTIY